VFFHIFLAAILKSKMAAKGQPSRIKMSRKYLRSKILTLWCSLSGENYFLGHNTLFFGS
jgi:hypothetical protein